MQGTICKTTAATAEAGQKVGAAEKDQEIHGTEVHCPTSRQDHVTNQVLCFAQGTGRLEDSFSRRRKQT
jgi:hypothetical protein